MAQTANYNWETPDDTDLVKDGASAIRTLGSSIDTTTKALNPSTTLGDIEYRSSTANTNTRLGIGTTGQVLTVSGGVPAWAAISGGGMTSIASGSIAASATGIDITSISSSYTNLVLFLRNYSPTTACELRLRLNNNSVGDYSEIYFTPGGAANQIQGNSYFYLGDIQQAGQTGFSAIIELPDYTNTTGYKQIISQMSAADNNLYLMQGFTRATAAINRITVLVSTGSFDSGTYELFGVK